MSNLELFGNGFTSVSVLLAITFYNLWDTVEIRQRERMKRIELETCKRKTVLSEVSNDAC